MGRLTWGPSLELGFGDIDVQHRRLVALINRVERLAAGGGEPTEVAAVLDDLIGYTEVHFSFEERLMTVHGLGADQQEVDHLEEHRRLEQRVLDYRHRLDESGDALVPELLDFLTDWLRDHILGTDAAFVRALVAAGATSAA